MPYIKEINRLERIRWFRDLISLFPQIQNRSLQYLYKVCENNPEVEEDIISCMKEYTSIALSKTTEDFQAGLAEHLNCHRIQWPSTKKLNEKENDVRVAHFLLKLDECHNKDLLTDSEHSKLVNIIGNFQNKVTKLKEMDNETLSDLLRECLCRIPNLQRDKINLFLNQQGMAGRHPKHCELEERAISYLKHKGCIFAVDQVNLRHGKYNSTIDTLGCHKDGHIIGIEVKTDYDDYINGCEKQYYEYMAFSNVFYLLTNNPDIAEKAVEWSRKNSNGAMGVLYLDDNARELICLLKATTRSIDKTHRKIAFDNVAEKHFSVLIKKVQMNNKDGRPETIVSQFKDKIESEFSCQP